MKKVLTFSLIVLLASPMFVGCKSGTSCFTRNGSRVPILGSSASSDYSAAPVAASTGTPVVNAYPTNEVMMMNAASAYSQCAPCAPTQCEPCAPTQCNPCDPCSPSGARAGTTASGYPAGSYSGL
ncbi:MAG: hypothetical protein IJL92_02240 [Thermoguttaceae bacterium]|nr:hypothetical protein [Thermoguttaceae bacterium]